MLPCVWDLVAKKLLSVTTVRQVGLMLFKKRGGFKFVVTSGPTREFIDPLRYLSNPSTGRMGFHIARAGVNQGYNVVYICGPVPKRYREVPQAKNIQITSTTDMLAAVTAETCDRSVLIMAAAPADYRPERRYDHKLKKAEAPTIKLVPNPDILKTIRERVDKKKYKATFLVGFAAETHESEKNARKKLVSKGLDMIFLNDVSGANAGFGTDMNQLTVFFKGGDSQEWESDTKERLGYRIVLEIETRLLEQVR